MSEPFLGEIKIVGWGSFSGPARGWAYCNGQLLPINQNQALFALLGTTYGGNGQTNFALPDFRGKIPVHVGAGFIQGQTGGEYSHTVSLAEMPTHTHFVQCTNNVGTHPNPDNTVILSQSVANSFGPLSNPTAMNSAIVGNVGGSQPHENRQPFLVLRFMIALIGIFPSRS